MDYELKVSWIGVIGVDFTADTVRYQLAEALKDGIKSIYVELNSSGGSVAEALEIVDLIHRIQEQGVLMHCNVVGECASAATAVLAAFKKRSATYATFLFHEVWMQFDGSVNLSKSRQTAKMLEAYTEEIARIYVEGYGFDKELALRLLQGETTLSTDEAYALGILNAEPAKLSKDVVYNLMERDLAFARNLVDKQNKNKKPIMSKVKFNFKKLKVNGSVRRAVFALDVQTDAGLLIIMSESLEDAVGAMAILEDGTPASGEYVLEDGTVIVAEDGVVLEVRLPEPADEAEVVNETIEEPFGKNKQDVQDVQDANKEPEVKNNVKYTKKVNAKQTTDVRAQVLKRLGLN